MGILRDGIRCGDDVVVVAVEEGVVVVDRLVEVDGCVITDMVPGYRKRSTTVVDDFVIRRAAVGNLDSSKRGVFQFMVEFYSYGVVVVIGGRLAVVVWVRVDCEGGGMYGDWMEIPFSTTLSKQFFYEPRW